MSCAGGDRRAGGRLADEDVARHLGRNRDVEERQDGRREIGEATVLLQRTLSYDFFIGAVINFFLFFFELFDLVFFVGVMDDVLLFL